MSPPLGFLFLFFPTGLDLLNNPVKKKFFVNFIYLCMDRDDLRAPFFLALRACGGDPKKPVGGYREIRVGRGEGRGPQFYG